MVAIVLILVAASLGAGYAVGNSTKGIETETSTVVSTATLTKVSTSTATTTVSSVSTQSFTQTIPSDCLVSNVSGYSFGTIAIGTTSPAIVCVQLYEFNATSTAVLDPASLITIYGDEISNATSNFTITASASNIDLGGSCVLE